MYLCQPDTAKFANLTKVILRSKTPAVESMRSLLNFLKLNIFVNNKLNLLNCSMHLQNNIHALCGLPVRARHFLRWKQVNHLFFLQHPKIKIISLILLSIVTALSGEKASR